MSMKYSVYPRRDGLYNVTIYLGGDASETFYMLSETQKDDLIFRITEDANY